MKRQWIVYLLLFTCLWWFWYAPEANLMRYCDCYLSEQEFCLQAFDFNADGIVNLIDMAILFQRERND
jgi:hypothetical protein